ncbi:MAG: hydroxypyruvate isomerase [Xanthomonadales bacterium]|nr:hydroxypyruvate isomerase [Xanthomonadales bacterium]
MPRLAANLSFLYGELPFLERFAAAGRSGFRGVEFHFPYAWPADAVATAAREAGTEVVLFNLPAGDWEAGERGIACHPGRVAEFREGVERAAGYAQALGCTRLNCLAGIPPAGVSDAQAAETLVDNLRYAAARLAREDIRLLLEPINTRDIPGFLVSRTARALELIDRAGSSNLQLQYDIYHAQVMEGDLARTLEANLGRIGHVQLADNPGRAEPGTGEINFPFLLAYLDRIGYRGWVGCEYRPRAGTEAGLGWAQDWLGARAGRPADTSRSTT